MTAPKRGQSPNAQPVPMPPPGQRTLICDCGAHYLDNGPGRDAHRVVFGHNPAAKDQQP